MNSPLFQFDQSFREKGFNKIAGVDEVGRGPLAGPVVIAAVVLPSWFCHPGIKDSKMLSYIQRERLDSLIRRIAVDYAIISINATIIDDINIRKATHLGMELALHRLSSEFDIALVDGETIPSYYGKQQKIIKGDTLSLSIAAASIIAKVLRDRIMMHYDTLYPQFGFAKHKGYGTEYHRKIIKEYGLSPIHRKSFLSKIVPSHESKI